MELKNIYLIQASEKSLVNNTIAYLPYAVGTIAANAWSNKLVQNSFNLDRIVFLREPLEQLVDSLNKPFLVGFSSYVWNHEYNKAVAEEIKRRFPGCLIVFGGHNIPADTSILEENSFIDILIHGEGEEVFEELLCALASGGQFLDIPNISYRGDGSEPVQTKRMKLTGFDYPSPYSTGIFDQMIKSYPEIKFHGTLETNRGCSNHCAFCDWGTHKAGVKMFPMERIRQDIAWLSENKIEYVWGTDANFGQFDRDNQIADWIIQAKAGNGYPKSFRANYAKYNNRNVFELAKRFSDTELSKSTTISLQTLSGEALNNVGRSNMTLEHFSEVINLYRSAGIPTYSEMILALPGETYDSFTNGIGRLLDSGQHAMIEVYDCVLLANSALAEKDYISKHEIKTIRVPFFQYHCEAADDDVTEYSDIVVSTNTLSEEDWVRCKLFAFAVQSMHCLGLLRCFSIYLRNEKKVSYSDFYSGLVLWYLEHEETLGCKLFSKIREQLNAMIAEKQVPCFYDKRFGDVRWPLDEGIFLSCISDLDHFYGETAVYLKTFNINDNIFRELLTYQRSVICIPGNKTRQITQNYDFYSYILHAMNNAAKPLQKIKNTLALTSTCDYNDLAAYAREIVWYGRRLGLTIITNDNSRFMLENA
jgi:radical SAM superfamily enzyme YgiQ (UPF0313 family)